MSENNSRCNIENQRVKSFNKSENANNQPFWKKKNNTFWTMIWRATRGLARVLTIFEVGIALVKMLVLVSIAFRNWTILILKTYFK